MMMSHLWENSTHKLKKKSASFIFFLAKVGTVNDKAESTSFNIFAADCVFVIIEFVSPH